MNTTIDYEKIAQYCKAQISNLSTTDKGQKRLVFMFALVCAQAYVYSRSNHEHNAREFVEWLHDDPNAAQTAVAREFGL